MTKPISTAKTIRLIETGARIVADPPKPKEIGFQHTVLCQTSLPHRPTTARTWEREQGNVSLSIEAGRIMQGRRWVDVLLPHGEKPRLLLIYLNSEAVRTGSPIIDMERSMTAFVEALGIEPNGVHIREFKDQATRLATANIRFAVSNGPSSIQGQMHIVHVQDLKILSLWPKDERRRVMWSSNVRLSTDYYEALQGHSVPLDKRAVAGLKGSSLCLDIYCWLAQRLHRVQPSRPQQVSWPALKAQFGADYGRERDFRAKFTRALSVVQSVYQAARFEVTDEGLTLFCSPSPVSKRLVKGGLHP
jgi:hypothetical protein